MPRGASAVTRRSRRCRRSRSRRRCRSSTSDAACRRARCRRWRFSSWGSSFSNRARFLVRTWSRSQGSRRARGSIQRAMASRSARPLWWAVPMVALWSNLHGECVFGVLLIGIVALAELVRPSALTRREAVRALTVAVACAAALLLNPYGWGLFQYLYENVSVPQILEHRRAAAGLPADLSRILRLCRRRGALFLLSLPRRLTLAEAITARGVRGARVPVYPADAARLSRDRADARRRG